MNEFKKGRKVYDCRSQRYGRILKVNKRSVRLHLEERAGERRTRPLLTTSSFSTVLSVCDCQIECDCRRKGDDK